MGMNNLLRDVISSSDRMRQMNTYRGFGRNSIDLNELYHTVSKIGQDIAAASSKGKGIAGSQKKKKDEKSSHDGTGSKKKKSPEVVTDENPRYSEEQEAVGHEENVPKTPTDDKKQKYRLSCETGLTVHGTVMPDMQVKSDGVSGISSCTGKAMTPQMLREAILWSEVLGEPAAKKRQGKRVNQRNGN